MGGLILLLSGGKGRGHVNNKGLILISILILSDVDLIRAGFENARAGKAKGVKANNQPRGRPEGAVDGCRRLERERERERQSAGNKHVCVLYGRLFTKQASSRRFGC